MKQKDNWDLRRSWDSSWETKKGELSKSKEKRLLEISCGTKKYKKCKKKYKKYKKKYKKYGKKYNNFKRKYKKYRRRWKVLKKKREKQENGKFWLK